MIVSTVWPGRTTATLPPCTWARPVQMVMPQLLWSERLTGALLDRLTHRVHIIEANGESFRLRESKRRQRRGNGRKKQR